MGYAQHPVGARPPLEARAISKATSPRRRPQRKGRGRGLVAPRRPHETSSLARRSSPRRTPSRNSARRVAELESELGVRGHEHRKFVEIAEQQAKENAPLKPRSPSSRPLGQKSYLGPRQRGPDWPPSCVQKKLEDADRLGRDATTSVRQKFAGRIFRARTPSERRAWCPVPARGSRTMVAHPGGPRGGRRACWGGWSVVHPMGATLTTLAPAARRHRA